jgi:hypothetical protein
MYIKLIVCFFLSSNRYHQVVSSSSVIMFESFTQIRKDQIDFDSVKDAKLMIVNMRDDEAELLAYYPMNDPIFYFDGEFVEKVWNAIKVKNAYMRLYDILALGGFSILSENAKDVDYKEYFLSHKSSLIIILSINKYKYKQINQMLWFIKFRDITANSSLLRFMNRTGITIGELENVVNPHVRSRYTEFLEDEVVESDIIEEEHIIQEKKICNSPQEVLVTHDQFNAESSVRNMESIIRALQIEINVLTEIISCDRRANREEYAAQKVKTETSINALQLEVSDMKIKDTLHYLAYNTQFSNCKIHFMRIYVVLIIVFILALFL